MTRGVPVHLCVCARVCACLSVCACVRALYCSVILIEAIHTINCLD